MISNKYEIWLLCWIIDMSVEIPWFMTIDQTSATKCAHKGEQKNFEPQQEPCHFNAFVFAMRVQFFIPFRRLFEQLSLQRQVAIAKNTLTFLMSRKLSRNVPEPLSKDAVWERRSKRENNSSANNAWSGLSISFRICSLTSEERKYLAWKFHPRGAVKNGKAAFDTERSCSPQIFTLQHHKSFGKSFIIACIDEKEFPCATERCSILTSKEEEDFEGPLPTRALRPRIKPVRHRKKVKKGRRNYM